MRLSGPGGKNLEREGYLFDGYLVDSDTLLCGQAASDQFERELCRHGIEGALERLNGAYWYAVRKGDLLWFGVDHFGGGSLFYRLEPELTLFEDPFAEVANPGFCDAAICSLLASGFTLGQDTVYAGVRECSSGVLYEYDAASGSLEEKTWFKFNLNPEKEYEPAALEAALMRFLPRLGDAGSVLSASPERRSRFAHHPRRRPAEKPAPRKPSPTACRVRVISTSPVKSVRNWRFPTLLFRRRRPPEKAGSTPATWRRWCAACTWLAAFRRNPTGCRSASSPGDGSWSVRGIPAIGWPAPGSTPACTVPGRSNGWSSTSSTVISASRRFPAGTSPSCCGRESAKVSWPSCRIAERIPSPVRTGGTLEHRQKKYIVNSTRKYRHLGLQTYLPFFDRELMSVFMHLKMQYRFNQRAYIDLLRTQLYTGRLEILGRIENTRGNLDPGQAGGLRRESPMERLHQRLRELDRGKYRKRFLISSMQGYDEPAAMLSSRGRGFFMRQKVKDAFPLLNPCAEQLRGLGCPESARHVEWILRQQVSQMNPAGLFVCAFLPYLLEVE